MRRAIREHLRDVVAMIALFLLGMAATVVILINQGVQFPSWAPGVGSESFELKGEFTSAQAITPGQGQTVNINGVKVGEITEVEVSDSRAIVTMSIRNEYGELIKADATMLPRPRTGLQDMVIEVDPGTSEEQFTEGDTIPLTQTETQVQPDEILATLDADTRAYLKLLINDGGRAFTGDNGIALSQGLRRFEPFVRDIARINSLLSKRRRNIANAIHNFGEISQALADNDEDLAEFVDSTNAVIGAFANQEQALRAALQELPPTLTETLQALRSSNQFAIELTPALREIRPAARAFGPAQEQLQGFFAETVRPIRTQIRPFARQVQRPFKHLKGLATQLGPAAATLRTGFTDLNRFLNMLAYNPPGGGSEGYLFWLTWLNHNANALFQVQDAMGPLRRGIIINSCQTARLAEATVATRPFLRTLYELSNPPMIEDIC
jgi:phospholipid/cholesterol/gamma-HCH transport system substrate-binding protein